MGAYWFASLLVFLIGTVAEWAIIWAVLERAVQDKDAVLLRLYRAVLTVKTLVFALKVLVLLSNTWLDIIFLIVQIPTPFIDDIVRILFVLILSIIMLPMILLQAPLAPYSDVIWYLAALLPFIVEYSWLKRWLVRGYRAGCFKVPVTDKVLVWTVLAANLVAFVMEMLCGAYDLIEIIMVLVAIYILALSLVWRVLVRQPKRRGKIYGVVQVLLAGLLAFGIGATHTQIVTVPQVGAIYAAAVRHLVTVDHPSGGPVYLVGPEELSEAQRVAVVGGLADLSIDFLWVGSFDEVATDQMGAVVGGGAIVTLDDIQFRRDGSALVGVSSWWNGLTGLWTAYVVQEVDGTWQVVRDTGFTVVGRSR